jgi:hypothetical protein
MLTNVSYAVLVLLVTLGQNADPPGGGERRRDRDRDDEGPPSSASRCGLSAWSR